MTVLHLGVIDVPYAKHVPQSARRVGVRRKRYGTTTQPFSAPPSGAKSTGDVAEWIESRYHVMEVFYEDVGPDLIGDALAHSVAGAIENLFAGVPVERIAPTAEAESEIESAFRHFLIQEEMAGLGVPGVPTKAALLGISHRLKHPYAKSNPRRPSFVDTGLYQANFKVWVD